MLDQGVDHVWLDATGLEQFAERFPTIAAALEQAGLDPAVDWLPIAPAAHYLCGGVVTDLGRRLVAARPLGRGRGGCTGVHGANRLASNSLLEGMVFGARVVEAIVAGVDAARGDRGDARPCLGQAHRADPVAGRRARCSPGDRWQAAAHPPGRGPRRRVVIPTLGPCASELQRDPDRPRAGVLRSADSPRRGRCGRRRRRAAGWALPRHRGGVGAGQPVRGGRALVAAATARAESRGAHTRTDFPDRDDDRFRTRLIHR